MFNVTATGSPPLSYQWFKTTTGPIAGATTPMLKLQGVDEPDSGIYFVRVTNVFGTNKSANAPLMVTRADFGDAPSPYPTLLAADGARHVMVQGIFLGSGMNFEPDGQPEPNASLDAFDDGVLFLSPLVRGSACQVRVIASARGFLDGWIDFNANGDWGDPAEQIFTSAPLVPGTNWLTFAVPTTVAAGTTSTFARFRFSSLGGLHPTSLAADGEVEDYRVPMFPAAADLCVSATITPNPILPPGTGQCLITVTNVGPSPASNVVLTNTLPGVDVLAVQGGTTACTITGDQVLCFVGTLQAGEMRAVSFGFRPRQISLLTNVLFAGSDVFDPNPTNNRAMVVARAGQSLVIITPPQNVRVRAGESATFSVTAQGSGHLTYQWFSNGAAITGATNSTLTLVNVQDSAELQVQVADALSAILSPPASLMVVKPPVVLLPPLIMPVPTNTSSQLSVQADGTQPLQYQWRLNGANIPGATNRDYLIVNAKRLDGGNYTVAIANDAGVVVTDPVPLTFPDFQRVDGSDNLGQAPFLPPPGTASPFQGVVQSDNFTATKEPLEPNHAGEPGGASVWYRWTAPATGIATFETVGSTFDTLLAVYGGTNFNSLPEAGSDDDRGGYFRSMVQFNVTQGQTYSIAVDGFGGRQGPFLLGWNVEPTTQFLPGIVTQPRSRSVPRGVAYTLSVDATNVPPGAPLFFQWLFNGTPIPGSNGSSFTIPSVKAQQVGIYTVRVFNTSGRFVESRPAIVEIGPMPNIQSQDKVEDLNFTGSAGNSHGLTRAPKFSLGGGPAFVSAAFGIPGSQTMNNTNSTADLDCFRIGSATRWLGIEVTNDPSALGSLLRVDTAGSAILTELAVYRFTTLSCLQSVPCMHSQIIGCDTNGGAGDSYSIVEFTPVLGADYLVFADGLAGAQGAIQMNWQLGAQPLLDPPAGGCFLVVPAGTNVTLTSGLTNNPSPAPAYQWSCNGLPLAGATNSTLAFNPIQSSQAGVYSVIISNSLGAATNNCCVVVDPPQLRYQTSLTNVPPLFSISAAMLPGWVMQGATNLTPSITWQNLLTNMTTNCSCQFVSPMAGTNGQLLPQRLYRAATP